MVIAQDRIWHPKPADAGDDEHWRNDEKKKKSKKAVSSGGGSRDGRGS